MPSRKVISIFIVSIALVGSVVLAAAPKTTKKISQTVTGSLSAGPEVKLASNADWQNEVQNLDPISPSQTNSSSTETLTDRFSVSFMQNYLALKQNGNLDQTSKSNLVDTSFQFIESNNIKTYTLKDILVSSDISKTALTKYGTDMGAALKSNAPSGKSDNEIVTFKNMMANKDDSLAPELKNIAEVYANTADSLSKVAVPSSLVESHLQFLNSISALSSTVGDMSQGLSDPIKGLRAIGSYTQYTNNLINSKKEIESILLTDGVNYKQGENGYYFFFGI